MSDGTTTALRARREAGIRAEQRFGHLPDAELLARARIAAQRLDDLCAEARLLDEKLRRARRDAEDLGNLSFSRGLL